jgi:hypothetical protein
MLDLFTRSRRDARSVKPSSFRPMLERLEDRDCPSTINVFIASYAANKQVTVRGFVNNTPSPGGLTVQLSGAVSGSTTTNDSGQFSATLTATALDKIFAATADGLSNTAQVMLWDPTPQISNFTVTSYSHGMYMFSGTVSGNTQGETVTFGGMVVSTDGQVVTVNSNGSFSFVIQLSGADDTGSVTAQATDWWGQTSNLATTWVS